MTNPSPNEGPVNLMFVDIKNGTQSNKYYNMIPMGSHFEVEYGRFGSTKATKTYPISKWSSTYHSKVKKGYKDITHLKKGETVVVEGSGNSDFDEFYDAFAKYTGQAVNKNYISDQCTKQQLEEAQKLLNKLPRLKKVDTINANLKQLYVTIPRYMRDVRSYLINDLKDLPKLISREQDALDSMDSSNIMHTSNPYKELGITFELEPDLKKMEDLLYPTMGYRSERIHKVYKILHPNQRNFDNWMQTQKDKTTQLLIHGTRNPNVFSILKSGLLVRPTNAASFAGSAYGDGVYHSAHSAKSLNYVGHDSDKIFFIQNVHMGRHYTYSGWYRDGKDLSRSQMNYQGLSNLGYDSLYVKAGDGLLNSEYIVYNSEQTVTNYLVWMK